MLSQGIFQQFRYTFALLMTLGILIPNGVVASQEGFPVVLKGQHDGTAFKVLQIAKGLDIPWGLALTDTNHLIVTERSGSAKKIHRFEGKITRISGIPKVSAEGQGGLLDVAVPCPGESQWIYFTYAKPVGDEAATTLARARLSNNRLENWQDLIVTRSVSDNGRHFGSRIAFDNEGFVYFSVGDRGHRPNGQDLSSHAGSILRVTPEGEIPKDNPFIGNVYALPEIWSYGHRNPQGLAYDHKLRRLWSIEHGPRGGDEINLIKPGSNYGWPLVSYGKEYWGPFKVGEGTDKPGTVQPVKYYVPSIAPGSLIHYSGKAFPKWRNNPFSGALKLAHINRIVLDSKGQFIKEERLLEKLGERIRALLQSPEGWLYFSTDSGNIYVLMPD